MRVWWCGGRRVVGLFAIVVGAGGCVGLVPGTDDSVSLGTTSDGVLLRGEALPERGDGFVRARPGESTRWGTPELVAAVQQAAASVDRAYPGTEPLRVGDLSWPNGGRHPRHGSHRTGRDVDVIFYVTDDAGRPTRGRGWLAFDRFGVARESRAPNGQPSGRLFFFDDARNWQFVRSLVLDSEARVQWIFCSKGLKSRLLRYAAQHETSHEALFRAAWVLHEPRGARRHADHFHVRVACSPEQRALGCRDRGPVWPWIRDAAGKPSNGGPGMDDAALVQALMSDDGRIDEQGGPGRRAETVSPRAAR